MIKLSSLAHLFLKWGFKSPPLISYCLPAHAQIFSRGVRLTPKRWLGQKKAKNVHSDVFKIGFKTGPRRGTLEQISFIHKKRGELVVRKAYMVKVEEGMEAFMENGDSGSLVV